MIGDYHTFADKRIDYKSVAEYENFRFMQFSYVSQVTLCAVVIENVVVSCRSAPVLRRF